LEVGIGHPLEILLVVGLVQAVTMSAESYVALRLEEQAEEDEAGPGEATRQETVGSQLIKTAIQSSCLLERV
jgi:hypothetical protein